MTLFSLGITAAGIAVWAILLVASRIVLGHVALDPWSFSFAQLVTGGVMLILLAPGPSPRVRDVLRPATLTLGILRVLTAATLTAALVHISVTGAMVIGAINVSLAAVSVAVCFSRRPVPWEWPGHLLILGLIAAVVTGLEGGWRNPAVPLLLLSEVCVVASTLIAERHPDNRDASVGQRLRFTGTVLVVTAGLFLLARGGEWLLAGSSVRDAGPMPLSPALLLLGPVFGVFLRAPAMFLSFWSIRLIGTQNYMIAAAMLPLIGCGFEWAAWSAGWLDSGPGGQEFWPALLIAAACLQIALARRRTKP